MDSLLAGRIENAELVKILGGLAALYAVISAALFAAMLHILGVRSEVVVGPRLLRRRRFEIETQRALGDAIISATLCPMRKTIGRSK